MMGTKICGIVLAGGKSSRMGTDKSELTYKGRTFLEIQVDKMKALGLSDIFISGKASDLPGTVCLPDVVADKGPLGGLYSCFLMCGGRPVLVLSVDLPLISLITLERLVTTFKAESCDGLVLSYKGRPEPLIAVYNSETTDILKELLEAGDLAVSAFMQQIDCRFLPFEGDSRELLNCNTPEDLSFL